MQHCYLHFCLALGSPNTSMTTLLRTTLDLTMNKSKALRLVFINLFLNEGHTVHTKKKITATSMSWLTAVGKN